MHDQSCAQLGRVMTTSLFLDLWAAVSALFRPALRAA